MPSFAPVDQKRSGSSSVTKPSAIAPMKRAHQPDLVTDSLSNSYVPPEVRHLEALCEARTRQLSHARVELQQSAVAVEALSVLVNYLCDNVSTVNCLCDNVSTVNCLCDNVSAVNCLCDNVSTVNCL